MKKVYMPRASNGTPPVRDAAQIKFATLENTGEDEMEIAVHCGSTLRRLEKMLTIPSLVWVIMAAVVGSLALYLKYVSRAEVDLLHLGEGEASEIPRQAAMADRLDVIDRWGKTLTIILLVYGVAIACGYLFVQWRESTLPVS
jgi:hypothetical protein